MYSEGGAGCMRICVNGALVCSSARDVTKHGDRSPFPTSVSWVSDRVGIDSKEIYAY